MSGFVQWRERDFRQHSAPGAFKLHFFKKFCSVFRLEGFAGVVQKVIQS